MKNPPCQESTDCCLRLTTHISKVRAPIDKQTDGQTDGCTDATKHIGLLQTKLDFYTKIPIPVATGLQDAKMS